jgi:hypothetical protein
MPLATLNPTPDDTTPETTLPIGPNTINAMIVSTGGRMDGGRMDIRFITLNMTPHITLGTTPNPAAITSIKNAKKAMSSKFGELGARPFI